MFEALFAQFAAELPTIWGHAGYGVNLPPTEREPNEASEYFWARIFGPEIDVGDPMGYEVKQLTGSIKTVDWLVALNADWLRRVGGALRARALPGKTWLPCSWLDSLKNPSLHKIRCGSDADLLSDQLSRSWSQVCLS